MRVLTALRVFTALLVLLFGALPAGATVYSVTNSNTSGAGSLAAAITSANNSAGPDEIHFAFAIKGVHTIPAPLPPITDALLIDGYTQGTENSETDPYKSNAKISIQLDGTAIPVKGAMLTVNAPDVTIRGVAINHIPSGLSAIRITASGTRAKVLGCFIGTSVDGVTDATDGKGIESAAEDIQIGGTDDADRNVISGSVGAGVRLDGGGSGIVVGNIIGGSATGLALGNTLGVEVFEHGSDPGDPAVVPRYQIGSGAGPNVIFANVGGGVRIGGATTRSVEVVRNIIAGNGVAGIDLGGDGPTSNDEDDSDTGPNALQNAPVLTFVRVAGTTAVRFEGRLVSDAADYHLEFFANKPSDDPAQGEYYLGALNGHYDPVNGPRAFQIEYALSPNVPIDARIFTVTATNLETGNTSEFSAGFEAESVEQVLLVKNTLNSGADSLRAAVTTAGTIAGRVAIEFQLPAFGPYVIPLQTTLDISDNMLIDGYTQGGSHPNTLAFGSDADIRVVIDGSNMPDNSDGLVNGGASVLLRGLSVQTMPRDGIVCSTALIEVEGCYVGMAPNGLNAAGNDRNGITLDDCSGSRIGGPDRSQRNIVTANGQDGILDSNSHDGIQIFNNIIGSNAAGGETYSNLRHGVLVDGSVGTLLGIPSEYFDDPAASGGNLIRNNNGSGVVVVGAETKVAIRSNLIFDNNEIGIDLGANGPTANDSNDADVGPNGLQNAPVIDDALLSGGVLEVTGSVDLPPGYAGGVAIEVFASESCDSLGGERLIGRTSFEVGENFDVDAAEPLPGERVIRATATTFTNLVGMTSEFSACFDLGDVCGDANGDQQVTASDALLGLKDAVGSFQCPDCICDVDNSGSTTSGDALRILRKAVGQAVTLVCQGFCGA